MYVCDTTTWIYWVVGLFYALLSSTGNKDASLLASTGDKYTEDHKRLIDSNHTIGPPVWGCNMTIASSLWSKVNNKVVPPPVVHRVIFKTECVTTAYLKCCVLSKWALLTSPRSLISAFGVWVAMILRIKPSAPVLYSSKPLFEPTLIPTSLIACSIPTLLVPWLYP